jgi:hypothetical protein
MRTVRADLRGQKMKPETAAALRKLDVRQSIELVRFMAELMSPQDFCDALLQTPKEPGDGYNLSANGDPIYAELLERFGGHLIDPDDLKIDQLHEAICEGRAQDVLDILTEATRENLRPVRDQNYLFPDRVRAIGWEF